MKTKSDISKRITQLQDEVKPQDVIQQIELPKKKVRKITDPILIAGLSPNEIIELKAQVQNEIVFDRKYKQGKVKNWQKNEEMYYAKKIASTESRANVDLARMQEFVHTLLSKIDNPLVFKFQKRKEAQLRRVQTLNALRNIDSQKDNWDIKDIVGKKQGIIYGRSIYAYYADSANGYQAHLDNVDVYDFLIDPAGGGIDIEKAMNMGRYGVVKSRKDLETLLLENDNSLVKSDIKNLLTGVANSTEKTQEETNKTTRMYGQNTLGDKQIENPDKFKFWEWFTTYKGTRYYLLIQDTGGFCIKIAKLTDLFSPTKEFPEGAWPFWSWAAFPDLTEFWTPSYCDYAREIFQAQNVSINQMLDNGEQRNKPQKAVNVMAIDNLNEVKYRKDGIIKVKGDFDVNKAIQVLQTQEITTPANVYNILEAIQEKASGVTSGAKGVADEEGKVGIYEGNQQATADRFGLLNKSYAFGYKRFAKLYEIGVRDNLTKKIAVDILGPDGIETKNIGRSDIFKKNDEFGVLVEASNAEEMAGMIKKTEKLVFLRGQTTNQNINQKKRFELEAKAAGLNEDEIKELLDVSEFGNQELLSEAERDIEAILEGEKVKPNMNANNAYRQKFVDYMKDHQEDMSDEQFGAMVTYVRGLEQVVMKNTTRMLNQDLIKAMSQPAVGSGTVQGGKIIQPPEENYGEISNNEE